MDISRIKQETELTEANTSGFHVGDHIVVQIKFDGANASFRYDKETGKLNSFSRKNPMLKHWMQASLKSIRIMYFLASGQLKIKFVISQNLEKFGLCMMCMM